MRTVRQVGKRCACGSRDKLVGKAGGGGFPKIVTRASCFFFQAEDGIRDKLVTGVQTCALPISGSPQSRDGTCRGRCGVASPASLRRPARGTPASVARCRRPGAPGGFGRAHASTKIGRASCRERV